MRPVLRDCGFEQLRMGQERSRQQFARAQEHFVSCSYGWKKPCVLRVAWESHAVDSRSMKERLRLLETRAQERQRLEALQREQHVWCVAWQRSPNRSPTLQG